VDKVLDALAFSAQNHAPVSGGEVYLDGGFQDVILMAAWNPAEQETQEAL